MRVVEWIKKELYDRLATGLPELEPPDEEESEEEEEPSDPVLGCRFRVTTVDEQGKDDRVLFVYGFDATEARSRIPAPLLLNARVEPAGHVEDGVVHFPPEELHQVMGSVRDGRAAPMK